MAKKKTDIGAPLALEEAAALPEAEDMIEGAESEASDVEVISDDAVTIPAEDAKPVDFTETPEPEPAPAQDHTIRPGSGLYRRLLELAKANKVKPGMQFRDGTREYLMVLDNDPVFVPTWTLSMDTTYGARTSMPRKERTVTLER